MPRKDSITLLRDQRGVVIFKKAKHAAVSRHEFLEAALMLLSPVRPDDVEKGLKAEVRARIVKHVCRLSRCHVRCLP